MTAYGPPPAYGPQPYGPPPPYGPPRRPRGPIVAAVVAVIAVLAAVGILVGIKASSGHGSPGATPPTIGVALPPFGSHPASSTASPTPAAAPSALVAEVTAVPPAVLDSAGEGMGVTPPSAVKGMPVASEDGKPLVFYYGAEFCPFCAAERWPLIVALSRFGTFTGLRTIYSSEEDVPTWTFEGSTYSSDYITFSAKEVEDQQGQPLDTLTSQETGIINTFNPQRSLPFVSFGNQAVTVGSNIGPTFLIGKTPEEVAAQLQGTNTVYALAIDGAANAFTTQICALTGNQPADVCSSAAALAWRT